jgi:hypothetical protein
MNKNKKIVYRKEIAYNNLGQFATRIRFTLKSTTNFYRFILRRGL